MDIQMLDPHKCIPYPQNTKIHTKEQIGDLKLLIQEYGFDQPLVVDKEMVIIKGHGRRQAAIELKLKEVPVIIADHLTPQQARLARIVDNDVASAEWDATMLKDDLLELQDLGGNMALACVAETEFESLLAATAPLEMEISDVVIPNIKPTKQCPHCKYRY